MVCLMPHKAFISVDTVLPQFHKIIWLLVIFLTPDLNTYLCIEDLGIWLNNLVLY